MILSLSLLFHHRLNQSCSLKVGPKNVHRTNTNFHNEKHNLGKNQDKLVIGASTAAVSTTSTIPGQTSDRC